MAETKRGGVDVFCNAELNSAMGLLKAFEGGVKGACKKSSATMGPLGSLRCRAVWWRGRWGNREAKSVKKKWPATCEPSGAYNGPGGGLQ